MHAFGDQISSSSETVLGLEQEVRDRAYFLWEQEGRAEGRADEYWARALDKHLRERAYVLWQQEGSCEGGAVKDWNELRDFQAR